jgi:hypothetical protein
MYGYFYEMIPRNVMLPFWARGMLARAGVLAGACVGIIAVVLFVNGSLGQDSEAPPPQAAKAPPARLEPMESPVPAKQEDAAEVKASAPAEAKPFSLGDAVRIVETAEKGSAVRALKAGTDADSTFYVELVGPAGARSGFQVNAAGAMSRTAVKTALPTNATTARMKPLGQSPNAKDIKVITLHEAVSFVERAGKGDVLKAERSGSGAVTQFDVEVAGEKDKTRRFVVNATGKAIVEALEPVQKKGKGKKGGR